MAELTSGTFTRRVIRTVLVVAVSVGVIYFLVARGDVLMLLFAGILFGVVLQSLSELLRRHTRLGYRAALALVTLAFVVATAAMMWFLSGRVAGQLGDLTQQLPRAYQQVLGWLQSNSLYQRFFAGSGQTLKPSAQSLLRHTTSIAQGLADFLAAIAIVFFIGLFGAAEPEVYAKGLVRLVSPERRPEVRALVSEIATNLFRWLVGRAIAMVAVGVVTAIGLVLFHIPMALALAWIATVLTFIPYVGAVVSAVPALLLAIPLGGTAVIAVVGIYVVAHIVEGYLLAPLVTRATVEFPPAFTLATQVLLGAVWGLAGLTLANPVTVVVVIMVQRLYVDCLEARPLRRPMQAERDETAWRPPEPHPHAQAQGGPPAPVGDDAPRG